MQWTIRLEAKTGWGEVQTFDIGRLERRVVGLAAHEIGLMLDEAKAVLAELQRRIVQTQIDEKVMCDRVCADCLSVRAIRDRRTRAANHVRNGAGGRAADQAVHLRGQRAILRRLVLTSIRSPA